jgi:hypothetical protein
MLHMSCSWTLQAPAALLLCRWLAKARAGGCGSLHSLLLPLLRRHHALPPSLG